MNCPRCGNTVQEDAIFCDQCGAKLTTTPPQGPSAPTQSHAAPEAPLASPGPTVCPACGAENVPGELFCSECGTPLESPEPVATAEPASPNAPLAATSEPAQETIISTEGNAPLCPACGAQVEPTDAYCYACGARLKEGQAAETLAAPMATQVPVQAETMAAPKECPSCGAQIQEGDLFCDFCGAALTATAAQQASPGVTVSEQAPRTTERGPSLFLEIVGANIEISLPQGVEVLVGREDPYSNIYPDIDLTPYGAEEAGVSRRHFKLTLGEGQYAIQDLGSTNYTWVNQRRLEPQIPVPLANGDEIRAGRLKMIFRVRL